MPTAKPLSLSDLKEAEWNPRTIDAASASGLKASIREFGDLSGIVFNLESGRLVCGHQRKARLVELYGPDLPIVPDAERPDELGFLLLPNGGRFPVRLVRWDGATHRAAMIAANSEALTGSWADDLDELLESLRSDLDERFVELRFEALLPPEPSTPPPPAADGTYKEQYGVIVICTSEAHQREVFESLKSAGHTCRVVVT